jgi:hypothetical protein
MVTPASGDGADSMYGRTETSMTGPPRAADSALPQFRRSAPETGGQAGSWVRTKVRCVLFGWGAAEMPARDFFKTRPTPMRSRYWNTFPAMTERRIGPRGAEDVCRLGMPPDDQELACDAQGNPCLAPLQGIAVDTEEVPKG